MPDLPGTAIVRARAAESIDDAILIVIEHLREADECGVDLRVELDYLKKEHVAWMLNV